jgi:phosphohistidine phosphatase
MIRLALVRHAKSDWSSPGLDDHDRPLNPRGERDAPAMAARLAATGFRPDVIVSSTALRARMTAQPFADEFDLPVVLERRLYAAPGSTLLRAVQDIGAGGAASVLLVAHNPGITDLAYGLSEERIARMPTCAIATFAWELESTKAHWQAIDAVEPVEWSLDVPR